MLFDCWVALSRYRKQPTICYLIVGSLYRATGDSAMARPCWSCRCSTSPTASPPPAPPTVCHRLATAHHRSPPPPPTFYIHPPPTTYRTLTLISSLATTALINPLPDEAAVPLPPPHPTPGLRHRCRLLRFGDNATHKRKCWWAGLHPVAR
jgi:hypothetical protein